MKLTLRRQLLASHIIPIFLLIPLIGLALIYFIEEDVLLPALANEMIDQGILIGKLSIADPGIWQNTDTAQAFVNQLDIHQPNHIALIESNGDLLAISRNSAGSEGSQIGNPVNDLLKSGLSPYAIRWQVQPDVFSSNPVLDVVVPVVNSSGNIIGMVRLYRLLSDINIGLQNIRLIILGILLIGLTISTLIGLVLAETMSRPLRQLTQAIAEAPLEGKAAPLPETGINEVHQLTHTFNRLQERRYQLETSRQQMLANLIHEIGRPLGGLQAAMYVFAGNNGRNKAIPKDIIIGMSERIDAMAHLVDDIATSFRQPLRPLELDRQPLALNEWLSVQIPIWEETAHARGIHWNPEIASDLPSIKADSGRLEQALGNLISNAFKYTPAGGTVQLKAGIRGRQVWVQVKDTGCGIPKEDQARIFEPFFRSSAQIENTHGLGLGLSITRTIVEAHHGRIHLDSIPGEGSSFTILLPI